MMFSHQLKTNNSTADATITAMSYQHENRIERSEHNWRTYLQGPLNEEDDRPERNFERLVNDQLDHSIRTLAEDATDGFFSLRADERREAAQAKLNAYIEKLDGKELERTKRLLPGLVTNLGSLPRQ